MIRKLFFGLALAAGAGLTVGCDAAKDAGKDAKKAATDAGKTMGDKAKEGMDKAKDVVKDGTDKAKDVAKEGADKAKEGLDKAGEAAKAAMDKAKTEFLKPMEDLYPKIEEKIKGLTGDPGTKAAAAFTTIKDLIAKFKASGVSEYAAMMGGITEKFTELKKMLGL